MLFRSAPTVADRIGRIDPLSWNDAWANAATRTPTGGIHDSVVSHNPQNPIVKFINETIIKIEDFHGIQDSRNQVPYLQWARQMKNFIKTRGAPGVELVKAMDWAVSQDRHASLTEDKIHYQFPVMPLDDALHILQLFIEKHTKGHARDVVTIEPTNGLDSWRKSYNDRLPDKEFQIQELKEKQLSQKKNTRIAGGAPYH